MEKNKKIFVQIASYRDPELISTIKHCIERAKNPENLKFSIVWQHSSDDVWDTIDEFKNDERFTITDIDYKESRGACWARNLGQQSWKDEEFTLQIDSHMRFIENWDEEVIRIWESLDDVNAIITGYPPNYSPTQTENEWYKVPQICNVYRFNHKYIGSRPANMDNWQEKEKPPKGVYISAGFIFGPGEINKTVPYDPDFYFSGEECAMAVRYFTNGYNIYNSHRVIVYHFYQRLDHSKHWGDNQQWVQYDKIAHDKLDCLLKRNNNFELGIYGLGTKRTLEEYEIYSGIDFKKQIVHRDTEKGIEPPCSNSEIGWDNEIVDFNKRLKWDYNTIVKCDDVRFWAMIVMDQHDVAIHRDDLPYNEYKDIIDGLVTSKQFIFTYSKNRQIPTRLLIWPYSESTQWLQSISQNIQYED
jgi:hypothetical protein